MTDNLQSIVDLGREAAESHCYIKDNEAQLEPFKKELTQRKTSLNKAIAGAFTQGTDLTPLMGGATVSRLSFPRHKTLIVLIKEVEYSTHAELDECDRLLANAEARVKELKQRKKHLRDSLLLKGKIDSKITGYKLRFDNQPIA